MYPLYFGLSGLLGALLGLSFFKEHLYMSYIDIVAFFLGGFLVAWGLKHILTDEERIDYSQIPLYIDHDAVYDEDSADLTIPIDNDLELRPAHSVATTPQRNQPYTLQSFGKTDSNPSSRYIRYRDEKPYQSTLSATQQSHQGLIPDQPPAASWGPRAGAAYQ